MKEQNHPNVIKIRNAHVHNLKQDVYKRQEPVVWYQLGELMKNAKNRVKIHTPYIICNDMMYNTWEEIAENDSDFSIMTNSVANNGNPFGAADYAKNRNRILSTGIDVYKRQEIDSIDVAFCGIL